MERLTKKTADGYTADTAQALERLGRYEDLHEALEREQAEIAERLSALRAQGREKTAQYRELFGRKLQNAYALSLLQSRGL